MVGGASSSSARVSWVSPWPRLLEVVVLPAGNELFSTQDLISTRLEFAEEVSVLGDQVAGFHLFSKRIQPNGG